MEGRSVGLAGEMTGAETDARADCGRETGADGCGLTFSGGVSGTTTGEASGVLVEGLGGSMLSFGT